MEKEGVKNIQELVGIEALEASRRSDIDLSP
jgi:hypothetical protein